MNPRSSPTTSVVGKVKWSTTTVNYHENHLNRCCFVFSNHHYGESELRRKNKPGITKKEGEEKPRDLVIRILGWKLHILEHNATSGLHLYTSFFLPLSNILSSLVLSILCKWKNEMKTGMYGELGMSGSWKLNGRCRSQSVWCASLKMDGADLNPCLFE